MAEISETLNRKDSALLAALLVEPTIAEAARKASVPERTAYRRLTEPDFAQAYRRARWEAVEHATCRLQTTAGAAVETLGAIMKDPAVTATARVAAARAVLDTAFRATELEFGERLDRIEAAIAELSGTEG
jgi:hypothetical protein